ncbi:unnamed protein product [Tilletia controversa]|uniref:deoxyribose-phosphate aldolase n=3 Tax=Tilletia TaxID=13289 RepID=A0A8X7SY53_9BASI|nr:hypothetical protein CF336_g2428 [Tilletia laevis]KAE8202068.1 hypothetical protein CF328_g2428 [Tilletia controversa]KAE8262930.1 hypothetical protein A4X03_0g2065 [Tilletia caries]KAE8206522.1 hypothetical protein CF335_g1823 [Tilletia laevis]KAE8250938.1 hypothetical protein A4X06_0g2879 [Tilletia controversa]
MASGMTYTDLELHSLVRSMFKELPATLDTDEPTRLAQIESSDAATLARTIDHTLLAPNASPTDIVTLCTVAHRAGTASVCVNSNMVPFAVAALGQLAKEAAKQQQQAGTTAQGANKPAVMAIAVVGFPFGAANTSAKVAETKQALAEGAQEIDMVIALSYLRAGLYSYLLNDIKAVVEAARSSPSSAAAPVKVILETANLNRDQIATASLLACLAGAAFIKTSTGYAIAPLEGRPLGARVEDVRLMAWVTAYHQRTFLRSSSDSSSSEGRVKVKASGGIGSAQVLRQMLAAGADRIGASRTEAIVRELVAPTPAPTSSAASTESESAPAPASSDAY